MSQSYLEIGLECVLDEVGIIVTPEQFTVMVKRLQGHLDVESEATGRCYIPDPSIAEIARIRKLHDQEMREATKDIELVKSLALRARGLHPDIAFVAVHNGQATFEERR